MTALLFLVAIGCLIGVPILILCVALLATKQGNSMRPPRYSGPIPPVGPFRGGPGTPNRGYGGTDWQQDFFTGGQPGPGYPHPHHDYPGGDYPGGGQSFGNHPGQYGGWSHHGESHGPGYGSPSSSYDSGPSSSSYDSGSSSSSDSGSSSSGDSGSSSSSSSD